MQFVSVGGGNSLETCTADKDCDGMSAIDYIMETKAKDFVVRFTVDLKMLYEAQETN